MKALCLTATCLLVLASQAVAAEPVDYLRDVKPLLVKHCIACHGADKKKAGLRLDTAALARLGSDSGPVVVPGKSATSRLYQAVSGGKDVRQMPPPKQPPLEAKEIALLKTWIDEGAKAPVAENAQIAARGASKHWAFQPIRHPELPPVELKAWARNGIDHFILARLEKDHVEPAPEADRRTLIRRLNLDLLGLPPSPAEVEAFVKDERPDAYERLVDRLLASPHYGERWARHWLDLAHYADSNGFTIDGPRSIWKYRDWVIAALDRDMPFDRFVIEQVAGDLLPNATIEQKIATGFLRNTLQNEEGGIDVEQFRVESIIDRVNTTGTIFLGLTIGCAQCHDHKFDPISQREYYQLFAFHNNCDEPTLELATPEQAALRQRLRGQRAVLDQQRRILDATSPAKEEAWEMGLTSQLRTQLPAEILTILMVPENGRSSAQKRALTAYLRQLDLVRHAAGGLGDPRGFLTAAHLQTMLFRVRVEKEIAELRKKEPAIVTTLVLQERAKPRSTNILIAGDFTRHGVIVDPAVPEVLPGLPKKARVDRLQLASWLVDASNPLTPRVTVNRIWQSYFGLGLVETENDFGTQGTPPTHPELLDWLASEFIARKWSMKALHRSIVTSATYRQSSRARAELAVVDPRNKLLARQTRLRLDAEIIRDVALAASGLLDKEIGGPSVFPPQPEGVYRFTQINKGWQADRGPGRYRRGMYTYFWRSAPHPGLTVFDAPDATNACTRRNRSNTPLQALTLLNDQAFFEFAQGLAERLLALPKLDDAQRVDSAFRLLLARAPQPREQQRLLAYLAGQRASFAADPKGTRQVVSPRAPKDADLVQLASWTMVARVLLNLDEFITRE